MQKHQQECKGVEEGEYSTYLVLATLNTGNPAVTKNRDQQRASLSLILHAGATDSQSTRNSAQIIQEINVRYEGFLTAQWKRIHLPMPKMRVPSLGQEDSPGEGNGIPLQYSCLGNPMDRGAWWAYSPWGCTRVGHDLVTEQQQGAMRSLS